jgi:site-specific DNA-methyltransferase (adenine-specific)
MKAPWTELGARWGHPWHAMCSYLGSFPPALARSFIEMLSVPGDVVMDPFSGRGTSLLEARIAGRTILASDLNPIAIALTKAKSVDVKPEDLKLRIDELRSEYLEFLYLPEANIQNEDIRLIFHPLTLAQLCYLRRTIVDSADPVDQFLVGIVLGIMHGKERQDGSSGYLSISMPNTFSMSPGYVKRFVETKRLNRIGRNVFEIMLEKVDRLFLQGGVAGGNCIVETADAKELASVEAFSPYHKKVKLIITSPPYLDIVNYAIQNWIRNWFMELNPKFGRAKDLDDNLPLDRWIKFSDVCTAQMREMLAPDGVIVLVVGDVSRKNGGSISLAREYLRRVLHNKTFKFVGCFSDVIKDGAKTTRIWGDTKGKATDMDRIVILSDMEPKFQYQTLVDAFPDVIEDALPVIEPEELAKYAEEFSQRSKILINGG